MPQQPLIRQILIDEGNRNYDGNLLLEPGSAILEIKVQQNMPLWLTNTLSENKIYKTSFSKVGTAYKLMNKQYVGIERRKGYEISI